jgi:hypothetical protein
MSVFKAGSTVPVKFQLKTPSGTIIQASAAPKWLAPVSGAASSAPVDESVYSNAATDGVLFRWDGSSQYIYNWKTDATMAGYTWRIGVSLPDGMSHFVVIALR